MPEGTKGLDGIYRDPSGKPVKQASTQVKPVSASLAGDRSFVDWLWGKPKPKDAQKPVDKKPVGQTKTPAKRKKTKKKITTGPKKAAESKKGALITPFIGSPMTPLLAETKNALFNSRLTLHITPCSPQLAKGLELFTLNSKMKEYRATLKQIGYELPPGDHIKICFQADFIPSESFSNDYGESFLSKMANVVSEGISDLNQITGSKTGTESLKKLSGAAASGTEGIPGLGSFMKAATDKAKDLDTMIKNASSKGGGGVGLMNAMMGGARVDFPQVWKNSAFAPSYSITVRLYNPAPGNEKAQDYYINGPLAALMLLGLPSAVEKEAKAYNYPYFHKIVCYGLFDIKQGAITSIQVTKGGEGQIGFNQQLGLVDVRMDFIDLHAHMIGSAASSSAIPTIKNYIAVLKQKVPLLSMYENNGGGFNENKLPPQDVKQAAPQIDSSGTPASRTLPDQQSLTNTLAAKNPTSLQNNSVNLSTLIPVSTVSQMNLSTQMKQIKSATESKAKGINLNKTMLAARNIAKEKARRHI